MMGSIFETLSWTSKLEDNLETSHFIQGLHVIHKDLDFSYKEFGYNSARFDNENCIR